MDALPVNYGDSVHPARTLSQVYYGNTTEYPEDMVTKYCQEKGKEEYRLTVKQLWLWTIDKGMNLYDL